MRICYFGAYDRDYCRNQILQRGIQLAGGDLVECHCAVWQTRDKSQVRGLAGKLATLGRYARSRGELRRRYRDLPEHDAVVVGYLGHFDVRLAKKLAKGKPVILDAFLSLYETVVEDREMLGPSHPAARWLKRIERAAYQRADLVLLDTNAHIEYVAEEFGLPREKFLRVLVGADDRLFAPPEAWPRGRRDGWPHLSNSHSGTGQAACPTDTRRVLFYGKFIPLHGVEHIIRAADILRDEPDIRFTLIGTGQTYDDARALATKLDAANIGWVDWVEYEELPQHIAAADVCLGVFSPRGKALRVIPNKVFQALACGAKVITADTPAMRELPDMEDALALVPPGDPEALAEAIRQACASREPLRRPPGVDEFMPERLGQQVLEAAERLMRKT